MCHSHYLVVNLCEGDECDITDAQLHKLEAHVRKIHL